MEYPNLLERKLIDVPANSRASRGTCTEFTDKYTRHDGRNTDNHRHDGRGSTKSSSTHVFLDEQGKKKSIHQTIYV